MKYMGKTPDIFDIRVQISAPIKLTVLSQNLWCRYTCTIRATNIELLILVSNFKMNTKFDTTPSYFSRMHRTPLTRIHRMPLISMNRMPLTRMHSKKRKVSVDQG